MKFYCDNCQTKYSIAEEKVRGKVLKVRCKKCSHVITVREPRAPAKTTTNTGSHGRRSEGRSASSPPPVPKWHYSINGRSYGPFDKKVLDEKFASGELGDASYVWNESFSDWKRVTEVPAFAEALRKAREVRPAQETHGVSQALEAIDSSKYDDGRATEGESAPAPEENARMARRPAGAAGAEKSPLDRLREKGSKAGRPAHSDEEDATELDVDLPDAVRQMRRANRSPDNDEAGEGTQDRLAKLRQRLQIDSPNESKAEPTSDRGVSLPTSDVDDEEPATSEFAKEFDGSASDVDVAHADTLAAEELNGAGVGPERGEAADFSAPSRGESVHDGLFSGDVDAPDTVDPLPAPEAAGPPSGADEDAEDAVPFFPSAPKLEKEDETETSTSISSVEEITDSLLIQLDEIKGDGRKQAIVGGIGAFMALIMAGTIGYFGFMMFTASDEEEGSDRPRIIEDGFGAEPDWATYTSEELAAISEEHVLEEQDLADIEVAQEPEEESGASAEGGAANPEGGSGSSYPSVDTSDINVDVSDDVFEQGQGDEVTGGRGEGVGGSALARQDDSSEGGNVDFDSLEGGGFGTGLGVDDDDELAVHEIDEDLGIGQQELQQGLTAQDRFDAQGRITGRVVHCRERHYNRGEGELPADSIQVQFYVLPDGDIVEFEITPASMHDTLFARCLERDKRHWNYFPRFEGNPERIVLPMSLQ